jgi:hypothetical protein
MPKMRTNRNDIRVHPNGILRLFDKSVEAIGAESMLTGRTYSVTREAWIGSVFLLGLKQLTGIIWWLKVNPIEASAEDVNAASYKQINKRKTEESTISIQVFTHRKTDNGSVYDGIKRKMQRVDLKGCILVCYLMKEERIRWRELNQQLKSLSPNASEIWIIGNVGGRRYGVFQVYPFVGKPAYVNPDENYQEANEPTFIYPYRAFSKGNEFENLGKTILLKPDFSFEDM